MPLNDVSDQLTAALGLDLPPVALAFLDAPPPGVQENAAVVPSACAFWRQAEQELVFAPAAAHFNCPIGAFVMGFDLPEAVEAELGGIVGQIVGNGYIGADEPAKLPRRETPSHGILYGPLRAFPVDPDAVLLWLTPGQAMIWSEATGGAAWGGGTPATAFGRPACAAIPASLRGGAPVLSLGCTGMRTFTGILPDRLLAVAPGSRIAAVAEAVEAAAGLNDQMRRYYEDRRSQLAGATPAS